MTSVSLSSMDFFLIYQGIFWLSSFNTLLLSRSHAHVSGSVELNTAYALEASPGWGALNAPPKVKGVDGIKFRSLRGSWRKST